MKQKVMVTTPKSCFIMSVYKKDNVEFLRLALESMRSQTYKNLHYLIMQDGTLPRELIEELNKFERTVDNVVLFRRNVNMGLATSLNELIEFALEKEFVYIARMDSDDICKPFRIEKQVKFLEEQPVVDVLGGACQEFDSTMAKEYKCPELSHNNLVSKLVRQCPFIHPTVMFRARLFKDKDLFYPTNTALTEDMALWVKLFRSGAVFANLPDILIEYRLSEETLIRRKGIKKAFDEAVMRWRVIPLLDSNKIKNYTHVLMLFGLRVMPVQMSKLIYKYLR
ncbi:glycosyltransferase [Vibrio alginolyticus]|uniref:glycosyltransferase n=1 Tax=Vibrio alginolyticus TaxID=663 RepID=UPI003754FC8C